MEFKFKNSMEMWQRYGQNLLVAMPYSDGIVAEARGCVLTDLDGNKMLDLAAGQFCSIVGHNHPKLVERLVEQTRAVVHLGSQYLSTSVLEAADKFAQVAPGKLRRSIFLSTGTEANELALSIAKQFTGRSGVVGMSRGYYGLSLLTKSLTAVFAGHPGGVQPKVPDTYSIMAPHCTHCPVQSTFPECNYLCLRASIEDRLAGGTDDLAAVIIEPIISAGGMIVPPPGYMRALRDFAHDHGALFIVDEAQTGFGRTGKWFAIEHHEVEPDILVISKGAGGGFPASGLITTDEIADQISREGFSHLASHQSDPISAAAVGAVIDIVREENLLERARVGGEYLRSRLLELKAKHPEIADVRGQGFMLGMEFASESRSETDAPSDLPVRVVALCERKGVHLTYSYFEPVLRFIPPINITDSEIDTAVRVLDEAISEAKVSTVALETLFPSNPCTLKFVENSSGKKTVRKIFSRLYETSPRFWAKKAGELLKR